MKKIIYLSLLIIFLSFSSVVCAQVISCPGISSVWPFVSKVMPVPFPQCAYIGYAIHKKSEVSHCKQIQKKLNKKFSQKLENWKCNYSSNGNSKFNYFFTFAPFATRQP